MNLAARQRSVTENKSVKVQARMEQSLKRDAEKVFNRLGVSPTEAIRIFYAQVKMQKGFPFELKIPNETTLAAMKEARHPENLETIEDDFFDNL